jgi:hypothetical protein
MRAVELVQLMRSRADDYERLGRASLTQEMRDILQKTADTFRRIADRIEVSPPRWLDLYPPPLGNLRGFRVFRHSERDMSPHYIIIRANECAAAALSTTDADRQMILLRMMNA